jgi:hypothetical protein
LQLCVSDRQWVLSGLTVMSMALTIDGAIVTLPAHTTAALRSAFEVVSGAS